MGYGQKFYGGVWKAPRNTRASLSEETHAGRAKPETKGHCSSNGIDNKFIYMSLLITTCDFIEGPNVKASQEEASDHVVIHGHEAQGKRVGNIFSVTHTKFE